MHFKKAYEIYGYHITGDPDQVDNPVRYGVELEEKLIDAYEEAQKARPRSLTKLLKLVEKYPTVPAFKNYLSVYYVNRHKMDKAFAVNQRIVREHPQYLHGKLNLAAQYIIREQYDRVPEVLGESLELKALFPDRKVFHTNEFESFVAVACQYLIATGRTDEAEMRLEALEKVYPESSKIEYIRSLLMSERRKRQTELHKQKLARREEKPIGKNYDKSCQTEEAPQLHHPELEVLYREGLQIPESTLRELLTLPKETLIDDLGTIFWDSVRRFEYFMQQEAREEEWKEEIYQFPLHAMFLLTELRATDQLPLLLGGLRQGEEYLEFWYGDHLFETLWQFIYYLGQDQLPLLRDFMLEPDIHYTGKAVVGQALAQIALHQPEREPEILTLYESVFEYFLEHLDEDLLIDPDTISHMISNIIDLPNGERLLPLIRQFFELDLVEIMMVGDFDDVEQEMAERKGDPLKLQPFNSVFDHYEHIVTRWYGYLTEEEQLASDARFEEKIRELEEKEKFLDKRLGSATGGSANPPSSVKVGRNEPCPCGSGKKYKKCCWGKD